VGNQTDCKIERLEPGHSVIPLCSFFPREAPRFHRILKILLLSLIESKSALIVIATICKIVYNLNSHNYIKYAWQTVRFEMTRSWE